MLNKFSCHVVVGDLMGQEQCQQLQSVMPALHRISTAGNDDQLIAFLIDSGS